MSTEKNYEAPKVVEMVDQKDGTKVPENADVNTLCCCKKCDRNEDPCCKCQCGDRV